MASVAKSERLMNLLIMLLVQRHYVTKDRIRDLLYAEETPEAFEKKFERDKDELRSLGVPIEVGHLDPLFEDEAGYRIRPDQLSLPEISLDAEEASVLALAGRTWEHARLARVTSVAVRKLTTQQVPIDLSALDIAVSRIDDEPAFEVFFQAAVDRAAVAFTYQGSPTGTPQRRHLEPWGVVRYAGRWYVVGHDTDRGAERIFRLSRMHGEVHRTGPAGGFTVPEGTDIGTIARSLAPRPQRLDITLAVRKGAGYGLRREGSLIEAGIMGPDGSTDWDRITLSEGLDSAVAEVLSYGPDVFVEGPEDVRIEVVRRLRLTLGAES